MIVKPVLAPGKPRTPSFKKLFLILITIACVLAVGFYGWRLWQKPPGDYYTTKQQIDSIAQQILTDTKLNVFSNKSDVSSGKGIFGEDDPNESVYQVTIKGNGLTQQEVFAVIDKTAQQQGMKQRYSDNERSIYKNRLFTLSGQYYPDRVDDRIEINIRSIEYKGSY